MNLRGGPQLSDTLVPPTPELAAGAERFSIQTSVVTAAVGLTAWRCGQTRSWPVRTALWTIAILIALTVAIPGADRRHGRASLNDAASDSGIRR